MRADDERSARFYADVGLLVPAKIDPASGYRFYSDDPLDRALLLSRLHEIPMPLATAKTVLDAEPDEAVRLVHGHVDTMVDAATAARWQGHPTQAGCFLLT